MQLIHAKYHDQISFDPNSRSWLNRDRKENLILTYRQEVRSGHPNLTLFMITVIKEIKKETL